MIERLAIFPSQKKIAVLKKWCTTGLKDFQNGQKSQITTKQRQIAKYDNIYSETDFKKGSSNTLDVYIQQSEQKFEERKVSSPQQQSMILANIWNLRTYYVGLTHLSGLFLRKNG